MAQGSIRKGFFFYFGLFVLLLVTVFLICLVIMMFNPGKTVLWMKYFSGNQTSAITKTTDESPTNIDYGSVSEIEINCSYANVTVQRNKEYADDYVVVRNNAKGFAGAANYTPFSWKATLEGTKLVVDITEPNGFLYFSKDIEVIINDNVTKGTATFSNITLTVNATGKSDIYLGGTTSKSEEDVSLKGVKLSTESGTITIGEKFKDSAVYGDFRLYSGTGSIKSLKKYSATSSDTGIQNSLVDVTIATNKGKINLDFARLGDRTLNVECKKGTVAISKIYAGNVAVSQTIQGNYKFDFVDCDLSFEKAEDSIISPYVTVGQINGNFVLLATSDSDAPVVKIDKLAGNLTYTAGKGSVTVSEIGGTISATSSNSTSMNFTVAETNSSVISISNEKGKVYLHFLGSVSTDARLSINSGATDIDFTINANFEAHCYKNGDNKTDPSSNVSVSINKDNVNYTNYENGVWTFTEGSVRGNITINSNGKINFNLVNVA
jgi:hypothetical protein